MEGEKEDKEEIYDMPDMYNFNCNRFGLWFYKKINSQNKQNPIKEKNKMDNSENWSYRLNRNVTSEEIKEDELRYVIDTLYVETKGLNLEIHSELVDEKLGKYEMYADVKEGDDFTKFTVSKEDMKFVIDKLCEIKKENVKEENVKEENVKEDLVNHPKHYTSHPSGIETIEITRWMNFNLGNSVKYILRSGKKSEDTAVQDLEKAIWYLKDEIKRLKGEYDAK